MANDIFSAGVVIEVEIKGLEEAQENLDRNARKIERGTINTVAEATVLIWRVTRRLTPRVTGRLLNSIHYEVQRLLGRVRTNLFYGPYVEEGTRYFGGRRMFSRAVEITRGQVNNVFTANVSVE